MTHVTLVFDRGELIWAVLIYCAVQFAIEYGLQAAARRRER